MKFLTLLLALSVMAAPASDIVILNPKTAGFLRIETAEAEEGDFEMTFTALGRIEAQPERVATVSTRIAGRIVRMEAYQGDQVENGAVLLEIESRQPGSPPPVIAVAAPREGIISQSNVRHGEPVEPDKALMEITDLKSVYAYARVPLSVSGKLAKGSVARLRVDAFPDKVWNGEFVRLAERADPDTASIDAIFRVPNESLQLRPGMRTEVSLILSHREGILRVPVSALQGNPIEQYVFVKHFDLPNAYQKTVVETGERNDEYVEVKSGLFPADEVVTLGAYPLSQSSGQGSLSLKEALDAAHGHEHAEDGSELSPEDLNKTTAGVESVAPAPAGYWKWVSFGLLFLWIATLAGKRLPRHS